MLPFSSLAVLFLVVLIPVLETEAKLLPGSLNFGKAWNKQTLSGIVKSDAVRQMTIDEMNRFDSPILLRGRPLSMQNKVPQKSVGAPFAWKSCGPADQMIEVRNLTIGPSPLSFPGTLVFGFDIVFHETISSSAKVKAALKLQVNAGGSWIDIPCIGEVGSCTYDDLCSILSKIQCPEDLKQQGIPCSCPFNKGEYKVQKYSVTINASVFLAGDYKAQAILTDSSSGQIACYQISFTVQ